MQAVYTDNVRATVLIDYCSQAAAFNHWDLSAQGNSSHGLLFPSSCLKRYQWDWPAQGLPMMAQYIQAMMEMLAEFVKLQIQQTNLVSAGQCVSAVQC